VGLIFDCACAPPASNPNANTNTEPRTGRFIDAPRFSNVHCTANPALPGLSCKARRRRLGNADFAMPQDSVSAA
jgi:hypothetical protein